MKFKKYLTKKNIIIFAIILVLMIIVGVIIYLYNNTILFKSGEQIRKDLNRIQEELNLDSDAQIEDSIYKNYVGVSNGTLYIKENADDKIKEAAKDLEIKYQKNVKSNNEILVIEPKKGTESINCKVVNNTEDIVRLSVYTASNLCEHSYIAGSIKDPKTVEKNEDQLYFTRVASNTQYTISNMFNEGINTIFFFDKNYNFISSTNENTFTTPNNANYIKVITDFNNINELEGYEIYYCLVLGTEAGDNFSANKVDVGIDVSDPDGVSFPMKDESLVIYVDGGEIELSYVEK